MKNTKTHIDKLVESTYLGGVELQDENGKTVDRIVTIKEIKKDTVFNAKTQDEEPVVTAYFTDCKPIILNKTNRTTLKKAVGTTIIEEMVGKQITLTTTPVKAFGQMWDAIRIVEQAPKILTDADISNALKQVQKIETLEALTNLYNSDIKFKTNKSIVEAIKSKSAELKAVKS